MAEGESSLRPQTSPESPRFAKTPLPTESRKAELPGAQHGPRPIGAKRDPPTEASRRQVQLSQHKEELGPQQRCLRGLGCPGESKVPILARVEGEVRGHAPRDLGTPPSVSLGWCGTAPAN